MRAILDRVLWRLLRAVFRPQDINGMAFVDIRVDTERSDAIRGLLHEAMAYIDQAGGNTCDVVRQHVRFVAATREPAERVSTNLHAYLSPFKGHEAKNAFFLACRLVGVAEYFRQVSAKAADPDARRIAVGAELEFAARFPGSEDWIRYLKRSPISRA